MHRRVVCFWVYFVDVDEASADGGDDRARDKARDAEDEEEEEREGGAALRCLLSKQKTISVSLSHGWAASKPSFAVTSTPSYSKGRKRVARACTAISEPL